MLTMKYFTINKNTLKNMGGLDKMSITILGKGQPVLSEYPEWCGYALGDNKIYLDETVQDNHLKICNE